MAQPKSLKLYDISTLVPRLTYSNLTIMDSSNDGRSSMPSQRHWGPIENQPPMR